MNVNIYNAATIALILANAAIAAFVYSRNRNNAVNYTFAALTLAIASWIMVNFMADNSSGQAALIWTKLTFVTTAIFAWLLLVFVLIFPEREKKPSLAADLLLAAPALVVCLLMSTDLIVKGVSLQPWGVDVIFGPWDLVFAVYFLGYIAAAVGLLVRKTRKARGATRQQMFYVLLGLSLGIGLATTTNLIIPLAFNLFYPSKFGHLFTILFVAFTAYAITKHKLMDIEIVIKKTLSYSLLTAFLTGIFLSAILVSDYWLRSLVGHSSLWIGILAAFVVALIFQPLRDAVQNIVDRYFFRRRYNYQQIIRKYNIALVRPMPDLDRFARLAPYLLWKSLKLTGASFMSLDRESRTYAVRAGVGDHGPAQGRSIPAQSALIKELTSNFKEINLEEINEALKGDNSLTPEARAHWQQLKAELEELGTVLVIPAVSESKYFKEPTLLAALNLGKKLSDESYSKEDLNFLELMATQAAISIENGFILEELKKNQAQVIKSEKLAALGTTVAGIAHELKNPLTYLLTVAQSMAASWDNPAFKESVVKMFPSEVERMKLIIDGLSDYSKSHDLSIEPVELTAIIEKALAILGYEIKKNNVFVVKNYPRDNEQKAVALADKNRIVQVFMNIIANGVQAMAEKGGDLAITVHRQEQEIRVSITDTGPGIPENKLQKIFDPFFTTKATGTGLGLSITKKIVEEHLGSIYIDSHIGEGSTFTICLPAA